MDGGKTMITGPVTGGSHGWAFGTPVLDVEEHGYREDEFFLDGVASRYRLVGASEPSFDGRWDVEPVETAPFTTRLIVQRPTDADRFNGTVVLLWNNVSAGFDTSGLGDTIELLDGYAIVGATTQHVAVNGMGENPQGLSVWDAERYGSLSIPSDDYSFDIYTQATRAVGRDRSAAMVDPLGGLEVRQVIAYGSSQSAGRLATYINAVQPIADAIDGFVIGLYFGSGAPLEVGDTVANATNPEYMRRMTGPGSHLLRDDLDVPVMIVNSEMEAITCYRVRQPDTDRFRWWEVAGTSHGSVPGARMMARRTERDLVGIAVPTVEGINPVSTTPVVDAAIRHMPSWAAGGPPPPIQPRIEFAGDPPEVVRDDDGTATGGIRLPQLRVPIGCYSSTPTGDQFGMLGSHLPFPTDELRARYGDPAGYVARFEQAAQAAVDDGVLLPRERERMLAEAEAIRF